jgi:hypothetical protein
MIKIKILQSLTLVLIYSFYTFWMESVTAADTYVPGHSLWKSVTRELSLSARSSQSVSQ